MPVMKPAVGCALLVLTAACSGAPSVVTTGDGPPTGTSTAAPVPTTTRSSNVHLANAFDFATQVDGATRYLFTTPSGRWQCAILPRVKAGCENVDSPTSAIGITGAPEEVAGADGEPATPNAVVVERDGDPRFVAQSPPEFGPEPGPATELSFNRILAVAGFRCNVQEASGVSCMSEFSGRGFTFSAEGYAMTYTDVPAGAP